VVVNAPQVAGPTITVTTAPPPPAVVVPPPVAAPPPPAPRIAAQPAVANAKDCAPTTEDYPAIAIKEEATGTTVVQFTVEASGKATAILKRSAGASRAHKALDRVALQKLSECKFRPGIDENGRAVPSAIVDVEYVWKLN